MQIRGLWPSPTVGSEPEFPALRSRCVSGIRIASTAIPVFVLGCLTVVVVAHPLRLFPGIFGHIGFMRPVPDILRHSGRHSRLRGPGVPRPAVRRSRSRIRPDWGNDPNTFSLDLGGVGARDARVGRCCHGRGRRQNHRRARAQRHLRRLRLQSKCQGLPLSDIAGINVLHRHNLFVSAQFLPGRGSRILLARKRLRPSRRRMLFGFLSSPHRRLALSL